MQKESCGPCATFFYNTAMSDACGVCLRASSAAVLVPDRDEHDPPYRVQTMCPLCIDALCALFPLSPQRLADREIGQMKDLRVHSSVHRARRRGSILNGRR